MEVTVDFVDIAVKLSKVVSRYCGYILWVLGIVVKSGFNVVVVTAVALFAVTKFSDSIWCVLCD